MNTCCVVSSLSSVLLLQSSSIVSLSVNQPRTMGDQVVQESTLGRRPVASCPCCCFLSDTTFLPPNLIQTDEQETVDENDISSSLDDNVNAVDALREISASAANSPIVLVDTHGHAHLDRERHEMYVDPEGESSNVPIVSLTCAVEESDWLETLKYASQSDSILPGLGVHPWYLADLSDSWLSNLETLLVKHPSAVVGEIGLCKMARFVRSHPDGKTAALEIQRQVFKDQMILAGRLQRPVSVHCVKQHGVFMKVLKELVGEGIRFPTAIGMHSFTGTAHHAKEILKFETENFPERKRLFYFGFSHIVNYEMCTSDKSRRQGREAVCAVPLDRLMAESDVHAAQDVAVGTAGSVAYIAQALEKPIVEVARLTAVNGLVFLKTSIEES